MSQILLGRELGVQLCAALGLGPSQTGRITINIDPSDVATITIEQFVTTDLGRRLETTLTEYELHARHRQLTDGFEIRPPDSRSGGARP